MKLHVQESERGLEHEIKVDFSTVNAVPVRPNVVDLAESPVLLPSVPSSKPTPFRSQLYWTLYKNLLLLSRRPVTVFFMLFSSVLAVLLAWPAGADSDAPLPEMDKCGTIPFHVLDALRYDWENRHLLIYSLNDSWRMGLPVAVLSLGPFVQAICAFLVVHSEIEKKLLGVLRTVGVKESVFWLSWYIPFVASSFINSLLAALVTLFIPVHVFQSVYFGGIFGSFFFLQLALVSASMFMASLCGSLRRLIILIMAVMVLAVFVPFFVVSSAYAFDSYSYYGTQSAGLFWLNSNTTQADVDYDYEYYGVSDGFGNNYTQSREVNRTYYECSVPIMNEEEGTRFKTLEQMGDVQRDSYFVGCYETPGFVSEMWNPTSGGASFALGCMYMLPYFHFTTIYSNFLGFTAMPGNEFSAKHASLSPEALAIDALAFPPDENNSNGTTLFPQGSTLRTERYDKWEQWQEWNDFEQTYYPDGQYPRYGSTCPQDGSLCEYRSTCNYVPNSTPLSGSPSVHDMIGYLLSLALIYMALAAYWIQVFTAGNGAARKFYFFLQPSYWLGARKGDADENMNIVQISNVSKRYGSFEAVKNLTLDLKSGEVTALLGHNGAGKSSLINMISCESTISSGEVKMFGNSVSEDPLAIRSMIGVCRQDDYLWPDLTAREHLNIFAGLRGVDSESREEIVNKWLESVDLAGVSQYSAAFSGGMKRRLSVALSTIGDRPLLILDEPTTGMDPISRRFVWRHLDEVKQNRVVLITTHAMEEADLLADEVAIMRKGELAAVGSPLELKSEHGSALQFDILVEKVNTERTETNIKDIFQKESQFVSVTSGDVGNITVKIDEVGNQNSGVSVEALASFVSWLERDDSMVTEYGFSNSSLEEVFLSITKDDLEPENNDAGVDNQETSGSIAGSEENTEGSNGVTTAQFDPREHIATFQPKLTILNQVEALLRQAFIRKWLGRRSLGEYIFFVLLIVGTQLFATCAAWIGYVDFLIPGMTLPVVTISLMLPSIVYPFYHDKMSGLFHLMRTQGLIELSFILGQAGYAFAIQFIYTFVMVILLYATPLFRETRMCEDEGNSVTGTDDFYGTDDYHRSPYDYEWCYDNQKFGKPYTDFGTTVSNPFDVQGIRNPEVTVIRTPGSFDYLIPIPFIFAMGTVGSAFASSIIPGNYKFALFIVIIFTLVASLAPLANIIYFIVANYYDYYEDSESETAMRKCLSSLDPLDLCGNITESFSDFRANIIEYLNPDDNSTLLGTGPLIEQYFSNITNGETTFGEYFMNCHGFGGGFSAAPIPLCTPAYASLLPQYGLLQLLSLALISDIKFTSDVPGYIEKDFLPNFEGLNCKGNVCKIPKIQSSFRANALYFFLGAICLIIVGGAMFVVTYFPPKSILRLKSTCTGFLGNLFLSKQKRSEEENIFEELEEVANEKNEVANIVRPLLNNINEGDDIEQGLYELPPIVMHNLRKVYPSSGRAPPKVALDSLDLHVPKGQVLGLLGHNGSGKSTCLKILATNHESSGGLAYVAGYDVSCERLAVFQNLGNCPQFDIIWPNLSVKNHLEFFARLKGLPRNELRDIAHSFAKAVGLGAPEVYTRNAGQLSGGMRRRLSIAISFIGAPNVLLLDEPSTGLDPSTRNEIWSLVGAFANGERALIITTHMMTEADTLCNRIAIIANGRLKVVATQQHLKDKFGSGYILQLNLVRSTPAHQDMAINFVKKHVHPDAKLDHKQAKTLHVSLPRDISLERVFSAMYSSERGSQGGINQFLLHQSSLEDVFISLGNA